MATTWKSAATPVRHGSINKNPNAFAMWKWKRDTRNSQPKCSLCPRPVKLLSCIVLASCHLVIVTSCAASPSRLSPPSSSPRSRAHAWYTPGGCPCRGSTLRRWQAMMCWGRSADCASSVYKAHPRRFPGHLTSVCWSRWQPHRTSGSSGSAGCPSRARPCRIRWGGTSG